MQSDQNLQSAFCIAKDAEFLHVDNEDLDQTGGSAGRFESPLGARVRRYFFTLPHIKYIFSE